MKTENKSTEIKKPDTKQDDKSGSRVPLVLSLLNSIGQTTAGIEKAAIYRHNALCEMEIESRLFFLNEQDAHQDEYIKKYGISTDDVINIYDIYTELNDAPLKKNSILEFAKRNCWHLGVFNNASQKPTDFHLLNAKNMIVGYAKVYETGNISYINILSTKGVILRRLIFNQNGYLVFEDFVDPNNVGAWLVRNVHNAKGEPVIKLYQKLVDKEYQIYGVEVLVQGVYFTFGTFTEFQKFTLEKVTAILAKEYDIILITDRDNYIDIIKSLPKGIKQVGILHNIHRSIDGKRFMYNTTILSKEISALITLTKWHADDIVKEFNPSYKIFTIPSSYTVENIRTEPPHPFDPNAPKFITVARLHEQKNITHMILAMKDIVKAIPKATLDIFGSGPEYASLAKAIKTTKLEKNVFLHDWTNNVHAEMSKRDIYLLTSKYEGLAIVLLEAQSCLLPCISYDVKYGSRDIINDGVNGLLVRQNDYYEFAQKLVELCKNPTLVETMKKNCNDTIKKFNKEVYKQKYKELIDYLVSNK
ncbi:MAG: glycosyltransferase [Christensenellaceae bacterium]|jgi:poly(glycerol-phosphate) alpha-glucosyltransferase|nr:glycosyltransferase [Christensenellaceae bacterium]